MIRMDFQKQISVVNKYCLIFFLSFFLACNQKGESLQTEINQDSLILISNDWKADSLGCYGKRDAEKIKQLIDQSNLIGKDTATLIVYLGHPNHKDYQDDKVIYYYYLECGDSGKVSYDNFYCYFRGDSLFSYQHKTF